jgi:hypothetical protein
MQKRQSKPIASFVVYLIHGQREKKIRSKKEKRKTATNIKARQTKAV